MGKFFSGIMLQINSLFNKELSVDSGVEYSLKKYLKTYKLLEEYDKKTIRNPEELADAGRLRLLIQDLLGKTT